jgi:predicted N-formylglutamate amidohydrolase
VPTTQLLNSREPRAVTIERPHASSAFVLACDHASARIPESLDSLGLQPEDLASHIAWDIGAGGVARRLAALLDATLVLQNYSRLVIDCNRPLAAFDSIAQVSGGVSIPGNAQLTPDDVQHRQEAIFVPYHDALRDIMEQRGARASVLVSVHSFTPLFLATSRPWHCAVLYNRDGRLAIALRDLLRRDGLLRIGENEPYAMLDASDYTVPVHGEARGLVHVELEIRQDLIADAAGQEHWAQRLADLLPQALGVVARQR